MNILEFLSSIKDPMTAMQGKMADMVGDDPEEFSERMESLAKVSAAMRPKMPAPPLGAMRPPQVKSSPAPVMGAAPNPYAPVSYGQPRGIGGAPTMEQILKALQSRGQ